MSESVQKRIQYLFTKLESGQHSSVYRALTELRTEFIPHPKRYSALIQAGGLKHVVNHLKDSNKKVVDVSLSILGHCALESEPRLLVKPSPVSFVFSSTTSSPIFTFQFRKEGGLAVLVQVLTKFEDEPTVRSRACRALGSLAHDKRNAAKLMDDLSAHFALGRLLDRAEDDETLCMAIRALHHLADTKEHVAILGKNHVLPKLSALLIRTESPDVIKKVLATLSHIFSFIRRFPESSAHYWVGSEGGGKLVVR